MVGEETEVVTPEVGLIAQPVTALGAVVSIVMLMAVEVQARALPRLSAMV